MALSNSQYDQLMRDYEQLQLDNEHELRLRFDEVYAKIPKLRTIDDTISSLSVKKQRDCWKETKMLFLHFMKSS